MRDSIEVKRELSFDDLDRFFWSGARDRWDDATDEQKEMVWDRILEIFAYGDESIPSETEINDLVWFECDDIFFPKEDDEEDDEEMDESIRRRRNLRRVIESRRRKSIKNESSAYSWVNGRGKFLYGKNGMQEKAEEINFRLAKSNNINLKDTDINTIGGGKTSYIIIRESTLSTRKFHSPVMIITLDNEKDKIGVSSVSEEIDWIDVYPERLMTLDIDDVIRLIESSKEFKDGIKEYEKTLEQKAENKRRRIARK